MEENVPIEKSSTKKFEKTVKGIKKLLKSGKLKPDKEGKDEDKPSPNIAKNRGVVYIGHIPNGFFEEQMSAYFKQFGKVTNVRVARSKKNGNSRGFGFVEFQDKEVAQIVAETMNNYLMDKRLLKAEYIPPEKQRTNLFRGQNWVAGKLAPGITKRNKAVRKHNQTVSEEEWINEAKRQLTKLNKTKSRLRSLGIDYDFFTPCDVPDELKDFKPPAPQHHDNPDKSKGGKKQKKGKAEDEAESEDVSPDKKSKKEKSMTRPATPAVKPPKVKKAHEANKSGAFVRPLLSFNDKREAEEKSEKKNKKNKQQNGTGHKKHQKPNSDKKEDFLKQKEFGGIKKKGGGKKSKPESKNTAKEALKSKALKAMMDSGVVKKIDGSKLPGFQKKHKKHVK